MPKANDARKREPACERTGRELFEGMKTYPFPEFETSFPPPVPPGFALPQGLRRMLNHLEQTGRLHAYIWLVTLFLRREEVKIPTGLFRHDPAATGSGGKKDPGKADLGYHALCLQLQKSLPSSDFGEEQFSAAFNRPPSWAASEIAKELIPKAYAENREAARKKIQEAIASVKQELSEIPQQVVNGFRAMTVADGLVIPLLSGDFPFEQ